LDEEERNADERRYGAEREFGRRPEGAPQQIGNDHQCRAGERASGKQRAMAMFARGADKVRNNEADESNQPGRSDSSSSEERCGDEHETRGSIDIEAQTGRSLFPECQHVDLSPEDDEE
jgi:hypothetical protein